MRIILLTDVAKLGRKFDIKEVASGYAQNLLIPQGLAVAATPEAMKRFEIERAASEGERKVQEELMSETFKGLSDFVLTVKGKANEKGHLFAGLHKAEITKELEAKRIMIDPEAIVLEHAIKEVGEHIIEVKSAGKSVKFKLIVEAL
ncbi:MAG: 50S ribosomal protein L9 [Candidatus Taylorbacteria bacterium]|nr:50S ribosomal protein L9 [Candidatus Taylorbacteria bacterium]